MGTTELQKIKKGEIYTLNGNFTHLYENALGWTSLMYSYVGKLVEVTAVGENYIHVTPCESLNGWGDKAYGNIFWCVFPESLHKIPNTFICELKAYLEQIQKK